MKIEALIPCHNSTRCVERAVTSVLVQSRPADRLTLHDDASTDGTAQILASLQARDGRIAVLASRKNLGILGSRQRLVAGASGDVLCFLDHDDEWPPDYLARVAEAMERPSVVACVAAAVNLDEERRELSTCRPGPEPLRASRREEAVRTVFLRYPVPTWSCLAIRRGAAVRIRELSGFPSGEEFALLALALEEGDVAFLPGRPVRRYVGSGNAILNPARQHRAELAVFLWFASRYPHLHGDLPAKMSAIYANSVYRHAVAGDAPGARAMRDALLRGVLHPKVLRGLGASVLGPRLLRWLRPPS